MDRIGRLETHAYEHVFEVDGMDDDKKRDSWLALKAKARGGAVAKDNQGNMTSLEDKIDVLLAQNQEIKVDTERTAEIVPEVMGDRAEAQIAEEESLEQGQDSLNEDQDPFAFLEEGMDELESDEKGESEEEESDIIEEGEDTADGEAPEDSEESDIIEDEDDEDYSDIIEEGEDSTVETEDEEAPETEEESEEVAVETEDEDESEDRTRKARPERPLTKTIPSVASTGRFTIVKRPDALPCAVSPNGKGNSEESLFEQMMKARGDADLGGPLMVGSGTDIRKAMENDWKLYRAIKRMDRF